MMLQVGWTLSSTTQAWTHHRNLSKVSCLFLRLASSDQLMYPMLTAIPTCFSFCTRPRDGFVRRKLVNAESILCRSC
jgi:hypothetical protein